MREFQSGRSQVTREAPVAGQLVVESTPWKEPPSWLPSGLHSLAYRNFLLLVIGQITNSLSLWMDLVARSVLVIALTGSAVQLGLITVARGLPLLVLAPIAGLLADRVDRRLLILISKTLSLVVNVGFVAIIMTGQLALWHVYVTAIARSVIMAFDGPARQALLPALVPSRLLFNAVGINTGSLQMTRVISASVAGLLIAFWVVAFDLGENDARAFGGVYLAIAIASVIAVVATYLLRVPPAARVERAQDSWVTSFVEGARFVRRTPLILGVLILMGVQSAFGVPYLQVFVPWIAIEVMGLGPGGAGLLIAVSGVGALVGAVVIAAKGHLLHRRGKIVIVGLAVYGVALAMLGLTSALPLVAVVGLTLPVLPLAMIFLVGIGQVAVQSIKQVLLLEVTPNELRGRVMSFQSLDRGFSTVGGAAGGFTIALIGGPLALALFGALCASGALMVGLLNRGLRNQD
ncbi:MAG: MFS transporter [Dehalococcoidia bacterium]|nr:MFS transporter [Dehalococcoidia bacterium]